MVLECFQLLNGPFMDIEQQGQLVNDEAVAAGLLFLA